MILGRHLEPIIARYIREYPVLSIVGPRQSGKTTLARKLFPKHEYISLENLDLRRQADEDPRGFFDDHSGPLILDEVQRVPGLFSYLQERVDLKGTPGKYVLTGSQQFLLVEKITQSLAGRVANFRLLPFTEAEIQGRPPDRDIPSLFQFKPGVFRSNSPGSSARLMLSGFYPRIYDQHLDAHKWLENYVLTYVERDIRSLVNLGDLKTFEAFLRICASSSGQLLNLSAIGSSVGVSQPTAKRWLSLLETSGIVFLLQPHHKNFRKRLVKTPKLYFVDTGLLCFLLSIKTEAELISHPLYGAVFETLVVGEIYKRIVNLGEEPRLFFWRDKTGHEIDLLVDFGKTVLPIEIKSSRTHSSSFTEGIQKWLRLQGKSAAKGLVLYDGKQAVGQTGDLPVVPWWCL